MGAVARLDNPVVEERDGFIIVRDDLLPGGTKRRVIARLFGDAKEYVYASPVYGYAQIALAHASRDAGKDAKAWRFIRQYAKPRSLFWNVAA